MRRLWQKQKSDRGYAGHSGLSVSSKTTWTGKTASDTWLLCESCLSGQYQSGRKSRFFWLQEHAPELELIATIQVKMRVLPRGASGEVLAIGQKAAYFGRSRHFVNLVQGEGLYGFDGIRRTAELMMDAYLNEKDTEKLVVQKGWGCECCL
ncbi:MAG: hypothetical protein ACLROW_20645 [Roseburia faecis]